MSNLCKDFILAGIKNLLQRNYKMDIDKIDIEAEIDSTLTFGENWQRIKEKRIHGSGSCFTGNC